MDTLSISCFLLYHNFRKLLLCYNLIMSYCILIVSVLFCFQNNESLGYVNVYTVYAYVHVCICICVHMFMSVLNEIIIQWH